MTIYEEDANEVLLKTVFPRCRFEDYSRALCLLDPYALTVDWEVIKTAGRMNTIEIFFNFMIMDVNMNVLKRNPDRVEQAQINRMDRAWGDHSWREIAYTKEPGLFGDFEQKIDNKTLAEAFRVRLKEEAGFAYVPQPLPMRNDQGAVVYYLYFASPTKQDTRLSAISSTLTATKELANRRKVINRMDRFNMESLNRMFKDQSRL